MEKLLKDGVLSQEEFEKTKQFLKNKEESGENIDLDDYVSTQDSTLLSYEFIYPKDPGRKSWEKTEIIYKNFKILPHRPGGIKIVRASDNKNYFILLIILNINILMGEKNLLLLKNLFMMLVPVLI